MFTIQLFSHIDDDMGDDDGSDDDDDSVDDDDCDELYREKLHCVERHNVNIRDFDDDGGEDGDGDDNDDDDCDVGAPVRQREAAGEGHGWRQKL